MRKLRLALGILSGRLNDVSNLDCADIYELGYDYYGNPSLQDLKERAEEIIYNALTIPGYTE